MGKSTPLVETESARSTSTEPGTGYEDLKKDNLTESGAVFKVAQNTFNKMWHILED